MIKSIISILYFPFFILLDRPSQHSSLEKANNILGGGILLVIFALVFNIPTINAMFHGHNIFTYTITQVDKYGHSYQMPISSLFYIGLLCSIFGLYSATAGIFYKIYKLYE